MNSLGNKSTDMALGDRPGGDVDAQQTSGSSVGARKQWVEVPKPGGNDGAWCYSDKRSYIQNDIVTLHISSTQSDIQLKIYRDGFNKSLVYDTSLHDVQFQEVPKEAYANGCNWAPTLRVPASWEPGAYLVELTGATENKDKVLGHHLFVVKPRKPRENAIALVASTSTWAAYNDWGGASHYFGIDPRFLRGRSPVLHTQRPWARGQIWLPDDAPRVVNEKRMKSPSPIRYEAIEWAYLNGFAKLYSSAGWASYERHFVLWAESNGYEIDIYTQDDLHFKNGLLDPYRCTVFVGHDEYWTAEMRAAVDTYVNNGGNVFRMAGNFMWQSRFESNGDLQVTYKYSAREEDPALTEVGKHAITGAWEDPWVGNPGATTFGVNALRGMYAGFGGMAARSARGFNVFRPDHWCFTGTGLGYGDMFGDEPAIFGFEMDGLEYTFVDGLPEPTFSDGAPEGTKILAMNWSTSSENVLPEYENTKMIGDSDAQYAASVIDEDTSAENVKRRSRLSGMMVNFRRGEGEVMTAATCEWVNGLRTNDWYVERITQNILNRYLSLSQGD